MWVRLLGLLFWLEKFDRPRFKVIFVRGFEIVADQRIASLLGRVVAQLRWHRIAQV